MMGEGVATVYAFFFTLACACLVNRLFGIQYSFDYNKEKLDDLEYKDGLPLCIWGLVEQTLNFH